MIYEKGGLGHAVPNVLQVGQVNARGEMRVAAMKLFWVSGCPEVAANQRSTKLQRSRQTGTHRAAGGRRASR